MSYNSMMKAPYSATLCCPVGSELISQHCETLGRWLVGWLGLEDVQKKCRVGFPTSIWIWRICFAVLPSLLTKCLQSLGVFKASHQASHLPATGWPSKALHPHGSLASPMPSEPFPSDLRCAKKKRHKDHHCTKPGPCGEVFV